MLELNKLYNIDCMIGMRDFPDKYFDLCICDPPYGIGEDGGKCRTRKSKRTNGIAKTWDSNPPTKKYFDEIIRVSINQIVFGGAYFTDKLPVNRAWIYWQKNMGGDFADGELAWTSFDRVLRQYHGRSETFNRIHPTQKPIKLYKWLLQNYAKPGDKILDTHAGSCSSVIACIDGEFDWIAFELDEDYYKAALQRINNHVKQADLFNENKVNNIQTSIF